MGVTELIFSALLLATTVSMDTLASGFAYGTNNIKVPFSHVTVINIICSTLLGIAVFAGYFISKIIAPIVTVWISFSILASLGIFKIIQYFRKRGIGKSEEVRKITWIETITLAVGLSIDGIAVGLGSSIYNAKLIFCLIVIGFSLFTDVALFMLGNFIGRNVIRRTSLDLSWLSGIVLIAIAVAKLVF